MRNWLNRVMAGRYGMDQLGRMLSAVACILALIGIIGSRTILAYLWYPALALLFYDYFRMFSRNIYKRQTENQWYLDHTQKLRRKFHLRRDQFKQRKDYRFFSCPNCNTTVRVPKGKGILNITCPQCKERFTRKS